jgi:serine/threonine protein phosphatase PrpC
MPRAIAIEAARGSGQDRAAVFDDARSTVIALADGAGGTRRGELAATTIIESIAAIPRSRTDWCAVIEALDGDPRLDGGQSTAVVVAIARTTGLLTGASVGDSIAWLVRDGEIIDLTDRQQHKPLVGHGCAAMPLRSVICAGTLVVASDGLWRYAARADIARLASSPDLDSAARALVELVRLPSGRLQDDVSVVLFRR